jgi:hypothetical protein
MNESLRKGALTNPERRARGHETSIQSDHHHGIGVSTVSGVARMRVERIAAGWRRPARAVRAA